MCNNGPKSIAAAQNAINLHTFRAQKAQEKVLYIDVLGPKVARVARLKLHAVAALKSL